MDSNIIVALLGLLGSLGGSFGGILVSARLTNYRLEQLEKKVGEHNNFAHRMPTVEHSICEIENKVDKISESADKIPVMEEQIKVLNHRVGDLEKV